jgi:hypothetical protein
MNLLLEWAHSRDTFERLARTDAADLGANQSLGSRFHSSCLTRVKGDDFNLLKAIPARNNLLLGGHFAHCDHTYLLRRTNRPQTIKTIDIVSCPKNK